MFCFLNSLFNSVQLHEVVSNSIIIRAAGREREENEEEEDLRSAILFSFYFFSFQAAFGACFMNH